MTVHDVIERSGMPYSAAEAQETADKGFKVHKRDWMFRNGRWIRIHNWTSEEDLILRRDYRYSTDSLRRLSVRFGVSEHAVRLRLTRLGLLRQPIQWKKGELKFLAANYDKYSIAALAKMLKRSQSAVASQAHRQRVCRRVRDGWFTKTDVAWILGVDPAWVDRRIRNGHKVDVRPFDVSRDLGQTKHAGWMISEQSLRDFIRRYPEELTGHNVDFVMLVDILVGVKTDRDDNRTDVHCAPGEDGDDGTDKENENESENESENDYRYNIPNILDDDHPEEGVF